MVVGAHFNLAESVQSLDLVTSEFDRVYPFYDPPGG